MTAEWSEWRAPGVTTRLFTTRSGRTYRLTLSAPPGAPPPGGWPALWALDADQHGLTLMDTARRLGRRPQVTGVAPLAVVGVAPCDDADRQAQRHCDFTPGPATMPLKSGTHPETGGAAAFLETLSVDLSDAVAAAGTVAPGPIALWGHSLSAYFALWAATARPDLFRAVAAVSPSLWWDEAPLQSWPSPSPPVFLAVGEREGDDRPDGRRMIGRARDLHGRLARQGVRTDFLLCGDEDHASVISASAAAALRFLSASP